MTTPGPASGIVKGDVIEHNLVPGFRMAVLKVAPCGADFARPEPHDQYRIIDPEGNADWVCAYDVRKIPSAR